MDRISCDLLIIGAGSGGLSVAAGAAQMGADVVLLERHKMGGDCLNYGCVPSKALIQSAKTAHAMRGLAHCARLYPKVNVFVPLGSRVQSSICGKYFSIRPLI